MARQGVDRFTAATVFAGTADRQTSPPRRPFEAGPNGGVEMRVLELLTARLCHELSASIAAVSNGAELLADEDLGPEAPPGTNFARAAATLVGVSARNAAARLQFYRFAYGFGRGRALAGPQPHDLAAGFLDTSRIACDYPERVRALSPDWQKLACNLLSLGVEMLPRGGRLMLADRPLNVEAVGDAAALSSEARDAAALVAPIADLTSRTVQAYFTGLLAQALGCRLIGTAEPGRVRLRVVSAGA